MTALAMLPPPMKVMRGEGDAGVFMRAIVAARRGPRC
jgi:hypothetical protein